MGRDPNLLMIGTEFTSQGKRVKVGTGSGSHSPQRLPPNFFTFTFSVSPRIPFCLHLQSTHTRTRLPPTTGSMDLNNNVIETSIPRLPSLVSSSPSNIAIRESHESDAGGEDTDVCPLREDGVISDGRVDETDSCDPESQWSYSQKRESDPVTPRDMEDQEVIGVEDMRDDIELIVDLYLFVENTRWLFRCLLW